MPNPNYATALRTYVPNPFAQQQQQPPPMGGPGLPMSPAYPMGQRPQASIEMTPPPETPSSFGPSADSYLLSSAARMVGPGLLTHGVPSARRVVDPLGLTGRDEGRWRANIDPTTGTVNVKGRGQKWDDIFTNYLRTGQGEPTGGKGAFKRIKRQIEALRDSGWRYTG